MIFSKDGWGANWSSSSFDISVDILTIFNASQCDKTWLMSSILFCLLLKAIWLDRLVLPLIPPNQSLHTKVQDFWSVLKSTRLQISTQISLGVVLAILFTYAQSILWDFRSKRNMPMIPWPENFWSKTSFRITITNCENFIFARFITYIHTCFSFFGQSD